MTKLEVRVAKLEREMNEVRQLASGAHEDVATVQATLRAHVNTLEALHENQREMQKDITGLRKDVDGLRQDVDGLRQDVDTGFAEMREGFTKIGLGMAEMTALLNIAIGKDPATD
ncbi:hypothetical protein [Actinophytocola glycyrrhizae]|uniref:Uncharacterized protein n=1 Tax=Actinophytocola glycyrrhizae TaxID=2044873 RepID=A0ABV9RYF4_9PSEU